MRKYSSYILAAVIFLIGFISSCELIPEDEHVREANFEDAQKQTIYDYIIAGQDTFSSFRRILEVGGLAKTLSAYNPDNVDGYTLFLPDNDAVDNFIKNNDQYNSLDELLGDKAYSAAFCRYHVVNTGIHSNDFPFGALPALTLSDDNLTVSFVIEEDTSYYMINNQAHVKRPNLEMSNGFVHILENALEPITYTAYEWFVLHENEYSIFKAAIDATGFGDVLDLNTKDEDETRAAFTMLVEPDSVYQKRGINSLDDLIKMVSPEENNYTDPSNPLYNFVGYHLIEGNHFIDNFSEQSSNYSTYSEVPLNINGTGLDILINPGKEVYDTIISGMDTTYIDYVGFYYDQSNVLTQSGPIHLVDRILKQQRPSIATQTYQFESEVVFSEFAGEIGEFLIEDTANLRSLNVTGTDLFYVRTAKNAGLAWSDDYIFLDGDFVVRYEIPKILGGKYTVVIGAGEIGTNKAVLEVYIDGKQIGGLVEPAGTWGNSIIAREELGTIDFLKYESHVVEVRSLIPGEFRWDYIRFEPFSNN